MFLCGVLGWYKCVLCVVCVGGGVCVLEVCSPVCVCVPSCVISQFSVDKRMCNTMFDMLPP